MKIMLDKYSEFHIFGLSKHNERACLSYLAKVL